MTQPPRLTSLVVENPPWFAVLELGDHLVQDGCRVLCREVLAEPLDRPPLVSAAASR
jgi:hypothetical protein